MLARSDYALILILAVAPLVSGPLELRAQEGPRLQVSAGPAVSWASRGRDGHGDGAGMTVEHISTWTSWVRGRLYGGAYLSGANRDSCGSGVEPCSVSSRLGVAGAKIRLLLPIPWVGPFVEMGAGVSGGSIETRIAGHGFLGPIEEGESGLFLHRSVGLGLAFGPRHQYELSVDGFAHRGRRHMVGALVLGIEFSWD